MEAKQELAALRTRLARIRAKVVHDQAHFADTRKALVEAMVSAAERGVIDTRAIRGVYRILTALHPHLRPLYRRLAGFDRDMRAIEKMIGRPPAPPTGTGT